MDFIELTESEYKEYLQEASRYNSRIKLLVDINAGTSQRIE